MTKPKKIATPEKQPPSPCEWFECSHWYACKNEYLACEAFHWYVTAGKTVSPKMTWATRLGDAKRGKIDRNVVPTRERYMRIFSDESEGD